MYKHVFAQKRKQKYFKSLIQRKKAYVPKVVMDIYLSLCIFIILKL